MTDKKDPYFRDPLARDGGGASSGSSGGTGGPGGSGGAGGSSSRRPARPIPDDASIPVLTERLTLPPVDLDFTLPVPAESREPAHDHLRDLQRDLQADLPPDPPRASARDVMREPPREPSRTRQLTELEPEEPPPPSPFLHFSMASPVGHSFPAAPTFAPPVPPMSAHPPGAVSVGTRAGAVPVPPAPLPGASMLPQSSSMLPQSASMLPQGTTAPVGKTSISVPTSMLATPTLSATPISGPHWARLELELRESILRELAERLPRDVEAIVRRHMANALDEAIESATTALVARVAAEARLALASSMREIVDHAVKAELERLRGLKR